jgi:hypothetical protein
LEEIVDDTETTDADPVTVMASGSAADRAGAALKVSTIGFSGDAASARDA